jgi:hypothetical protein
MKTFCHCIFSFPSQQPTISAVSNPWVGHEASETTAVSSRTRHSGDNAAKKGAVNAGEVTPAADWHWIRECSGTLPITILAALSTVLLLGRSLTWISPSPCLIHLPYDYRFQSGFAASKHARQCPALFRCDALKPRRVSFYWPCYDCPALELSRLTNTWAWFRGRFNNTSFALLFKRICLVAASRPLA